MVNEQTLHAFPVLAHCQSDRWPLRPVIRTLQALEHQFSLKALVVRTAFLRTASFSHPPTPLHNSCLSSLFPCLSWSINQYHYIRGVLTLSRPSLGHTDPSGAALWALIPLFLSHVGLAPPLALSLAWASCPLFLLLSRGPCALPLSLLRACGPRAPFSRGLCSHICALHSWCRTIFSWPISRS